MPLTIVTQDSAYKCDSCGSLLNMKKGQLLPPCPRCGGKMEKTDGAVPDTGNRCCG
jgi:predicted RNA-binding Zn-ribbon protein involved in translation (DUF1610 family)